MILNDPPSEIRDDELLARYIFSKRHIRSIDSTVKPDAFCPPPNLEFSVTRHINLSEDELWIIGQSVGINRPEQNLHGRADFSAINPRTVGLQVKSAVISENKNHAVIVGWPSDKPSQKIIQLELARSSVFIPNPNPLM